MNLEERNQLKKEIVEKIVKAQEGATYNFAVTLLDELKRDLVSLGLNNKINTLN